MKLWVKITMWVLVSIIGTGVLGFGGCAGLFLFCRESNSCERFNIDNIETRTNIDIPSIYGGNDCPECMSCILDEVTNSKTNYFRIKIDVVDMDWYVQRNSFKSVNEVDLDLSVFEKLVKFPTITTYNKQSYYYNSNMGNGIRTDWLAVLDKNSGDLWVYMKYLD